MLFLFLMGYLFQQCIPLFEVNTNWNIYITFHYLLTISILIYSKFVMLTIMPKIKDFYDVLWFDFLCIDTTHSTCLSSWYISSIWCIVWCHYLFFRTSATFILKRANFFAKNKKLKHLPLMYQLCVTEWQFLCFCCND